MDTKNFPQEAYNKLVQHVYAPAFFTKLANYGLVPNNHEEAQYLLELASYLRNFRENSQSVQDHQRTNFIKEAVTNLKQVLGHDQPDYNHYYKAAASFAMNPEILEAASEYINYFLKHI